jgi:hypothetical protein
VSGSAAVRRVSSIVDGPADLWLMVRMGAWALALPLLKRTVRLERLARVMWVRPTRRASEGDLAKVVTLSQLLARRRPPLSNHRCMERSLLAYRYLSALGADPQLVVAMAAGADGLEGHAWVTVDGVPVDEAESVARYVPLVVYGAGGRRED